MCQMVFKKKNNNNNMQPFELFFFLNIKMIDSILYTLDIFQIICHR